MADYINLQKGILRMDSNVYPSPAAFYGPYESVDAAYNEISSALGENIPLGLKFGVVSGGTFSEYVFKDGITKDNIQSTESLVTVDSGLDATSTNPVQNKTLKSKFDSLESDLDNTYNKTESDNRYIKTADKGATSGVAPLVNGKIPSQYVPGGIDEIIEYESESAFPATGSSSKMYLAKDTGITYRWSGTQYVAIASSLALGETTGTAYDGGKGKELADTIATYKGAVAYDVVTIVPADPTTSSKLPTTKVVNDLVIGKGYLTSNDISGLAPKDNPTFTTKVTLPKTIDITGGEAGLMRFVPNQGVQFDSTNYANADDLGDAATHDVASAIAPNVQDLVTSSQVYSALIGKQDSIIDLADIRSGAALGTTAVQPATLAGRMLYKGTVSSVSQLPTSAVTSVGDTYMVGDEMYFAKSIKTDNNLYIYYIPDQSTDTYHVDLDMSTHTAVDDPSTATLANYPTIGAQYFNSSVRHGDGNFYVIPVNSSEYGLIVCLVQVQDSTRYIYTLNRNGYKQLNSWEGILDGQGSMIYCGTDGSIPSGQNVMYFAYFGGGVEWTQVTRSSGEQIYVDSKLSDTSENPVQNKVINAALEDISQTVDDNAIASVSKTLEASRVNLSTNTAGGSSYTCNIPAATSSTAGCMSAAQATALTNATNNISSLAADVERKVDLPQSITYTALKTLRDNSQLVPGAMYRITDYICSSAQNGTRAMGHQFDIVVTAISTSQLSTEASACLHSGDTYFTEEELSKYRLKYSLDNDSSIWAWAADEKYIRLAMPTLGDYSFVRDSSKDKTDQYAWYDMQTATTVYTEKEDVTTDDTAFVSCMINPIYAIKEVSGDGKKITIADYMIYGDTEFTLVSSAMQSSGKYYPIQWSNEDIGASVYSSVVQVEVGSRVRCSSQISILQNIAIAEVHEAGKGVIYNMVDDFNNDVDYDFKNIQFQRDDLFVEEYKNYAAYVTADGEIKTYLNSPDNYYYTFTTIDADENVIDNSTWAGRNVRELYYNHCIANDNNRISLMNGSANHESYRDLGVVMFLPNVIFVADLNLKIPHSYNVHQNKILLAHDMTLGCYNVYNNEFSGEYVYNNVFGSQGYCSGNKVAGDFECNRIRGSFTTNNLIDASFVANVMIGTKTTSSSTSDLYSAMQTSNVNGIFLNNKTSGYIANLAVTGYIGYNTFSGTIYYLTVDGQFYGNTVNGNVRVSNVGGNIGNNTFGGLMQVNLNGVMAFCNFQDTSGNNYAVTLVNVDFDGYYGYVDFQASLPSSSHRCALYHINGNIAGTSTSQKAISFTPRKISPTSSALPIRRINASTDGTIYDRVEGVQVFTYGTATYDNIVEAVSEGVLVQVLYNSGDDVYSFTGSYDSDSLGLIYYFSAIIPGVEDDGTCTVMNCGTLWCYKDKEGNTVWKNLQKQLS